MRYLVSEAIWDFGLDEDLTALPAWRRDEVMRYRREVDRRVRVVAHRLLRQLLDEEFGLNLDSLRVARTEQGKPFFPELPDVHFNISHCDVAVAVAVAHEPVGIDVEMVTELDMEVARRVLNDDELHDVLASPRPDVAFTRLWTIKESYLKMLGTGLVDDLPSLTTPTSHVCTTVSPSSRYVISVAL
ncbi:MAG: 4'-phosphopantetheinyl transferase superfamily protein [Muribaculaceae bacterium]|nr:4'-phosphopantetheinyl transferase superfamily protein [Muribaculaceae bacterium]